MSLTGALFLDTVIAITVLAFVLLIVGWHKLDGPGPRRVAGRVVAVLLVNLLVLLTAATQLNATYLFFASWGDIKGALTGHVAMTRLNRGATAASAANTRVTGSAAAAAGSTPPLSVPVSPTGVAQFTVTGPLSGLTGTVFVQLPPGYSSPASAGLRYPVLEAFGGYPGTPSTWIDVLKIGGALDKQARAHTMRPTLVVQPQIEFPSGVDTEGVNGSPGRPQVETWLTQDIPNWVARTFRVQTQRSAWASIGYSAGGWVAAMAALLHPAQYGAAIVLGGYFRPEFGPLYEPYPTQGALAQRYNLVALAKAKPPPVALWLETSHADTISYHSSAQFLAATRAPLSVKAVVLQNAGHRMSVWLGLLPEALAWLGTGVAGFGP
jgi:enterochelin esterase-like enzyme